METETGLAVEVRQPDVGKLLERLLVRVGDGLGEGHGVLHGSKPELGNTRELLVALLSELSDLSALLLVILVVRVGVLALGHLGVGGFSLARDDLQTPVVEGLVLAEELYVSGGVHASQTHLLLDLKDGQLELGLDLRVLDLEALEAVNTPADGGRQRLDVSRRAADERAELVLREREERGVLFVVSNNTTLDQN